MQSLFGAAAEQVGAPIEVLLCPHPGGPPVCWCRKPLPGLHLTALHRHGLAPAGSTVLGSSSTDRKVAAHLGLDFVAVESL